MKKTIKLFLIWLSSVLHRDTSPKVVFYHDIGTTYTSMGTPVDLFESHISYLQKIKGKPFRCPHTASACFAARASPSGDIPPTFSTCDFHGVAFDDGFRGMWDNRELLRKHDIRPIVFIAIALVGQPGYLTWDEIRTLQNDYGVNFQCHTWSHQTLIGPVNTGLPIPSDPNFRTDAWYHHELVDSKAELERQLNLGVGVGGRCRKVVTALCFPVGYFSDDVIKRCAAAGYTELYASFPGNIDDANSAVHLHLPPTPNDAACRIIPRCLCQYSSLLEFKSILNGGMNAMRKRYLAQHYRGK